MFFSLQKYGETIDRVGDYDNVMGEDAVLAMNREQLKSIDVFVLDQFEGQVFEHLQGTKALVLGPMCLLVCLMNDLRIPQGNSPIFTNGMRDMVITASGMDRAEKKKIKKLVSWMGGMFYYELNKGCTHLVSNSVRSEKYEIAASRRLKILMPEWIQAVWEASKVRAVRGDEFAFEKYRLPVFYNLNITSTNLTPSVRNEMRQAIEANGGKYAGAFRSEETDILILERDKTSSEKFRSAQTYKKDCLTPDWVRSSIQQGYAVAFKNFRVLGSVRSSTPTRASHEVAEFAPNSTQMSEISAIDHSKLKVVNETVASTSSESTRTTRSSKRTNPTYQHVMDKIPFDKVKRAGPFLDGCKVYLSGFQEADKEQLIKLLNSGGATRYDDLNEQVTHFVVGEHCEADFTTMKSNGVS